VKIALIGSHGVGKTTLCYGLAARLKRRDIALEVVHEVARRCPLPLNQQTTTAAQSWILHNQVAEEIVAESRYPVVICDRCVLDNYVYLLLSSGPQKGLEELVDQWMASYSLLVHVPVIEAPRPDGLRALDPSFQRQVDERLLQEIAERGISVLSLPGDERPRWVELLENIVVSHFGPAQLALF
jgi:thymidylate kinase